MKANIGDIIELTYRCRVDSLPTRDSLGVTDVERNLEFSVHGDKLIKTAKSADYFGKEEKVTKTKLAEVLTESRGVLTACFVKANGKERKLRGYLVTKETGMGRSNFIDLDVAKGSPVRQVDHRTLKWVVYDGVKYYV